MKRFIAIVLIPIAGATLAPTCTPQTSDCPAYCEAASDAEPISVVQDKCVAAFGPGFTVVVRTCPRGLVPAACASLSEYSEETVQCNPSDTRPDDVLCCWE
jgi:hypothetical protein